ncbi:conserved oligomeric Golgi complex subunit 5 [Euwallacea similis]|uniref:conserved oligomeric Golgi complex subunit 5 n=1 Tax=Euwallacea similis TaxID=1736056 RepID=UPI00344D2BA0
MENQELIAEIENDEFFQTYLSSNSKTLLSQSLAFTEQIKRLGEGIEVLNKELQKQVLENHHDLLQQANHANKLENVLNTMNVHIQNLFANAERLKVQITVPYDQLEIHTKVLGRLHRASHILRQVSRVQQLSKRLSNTNDPIQKAALLQELEQLAADSELTDIDAVTTELRNIRIQQQKVVKLATGSLNQGIVNENVIQTSTALQIFINLGLIKPTIENLVKQNLDECREALKLAFETSNIAPNKSKGGPGRVQLSSSQGFRAKIWTELERSFSEDIHAICKQIKFLQTILNELHIQSIDKNLAAQFWFQLGALIQDVINQSTLAVVQTLEEDYPKLLKNYYEMVKKLNYDQFQFDRGVLKKLENSYLSSSLTKILDPVQCMFRLENNVPSHDEIDSLIRVLTSELSVALVEEHLNEQVAKNVGKCVKMFAVKTEQQISTGPEAAQVLAGAPNAGQQKNVQYANVLHYLQTQIRRMLNNMKESLSESVINVIEESLNSLNSLTGAIIHPLTVSINSVIETIIITMHVEPDWTKLPVSVNKNISCSPYMRELVQFIDRVYNTYLSGFQNKEVLSEKCNEIALRCIELLVRHSSILRPVTQGGRLRLQADYQQMEDNLKIISPQLATLGRPYRLLKSMASLIAQTPEEIVTGQALGSSVPHSTILLMLFSFAGHDLASPHQNTGWSLPKLSAWLDEHPNETERIDLVAGAVQKYESIVRLMNSTNYDPVYPLISKLLEVAVKELS